MELEEAKVLVEIELKSIGCIWRYCEKSDYIAYQGELVNVSITGFANDCMVSIEFHIGEVRVDLSIFDATFGGISELFAEYKRIKGE